MFRLVLSFFVIGWKLYSFAWRRVALSRFAAIGKGCNVAPGQFSFNRVHIGNGVYTGEAARFWATNSRILIGDKCVFGPEVSIMAGDHDFRKFGRFVHDVGDDEKDASLDKDVIFDEDVWVGTRAIVLKGVRVCRGAVIGTGSVVTREVPPYAIVAGSPATIRRFRWSVEEILRHEHLLYPEDRRLPEVVLHISRIDGKQRGQGS
jgi:acetyltransferase-like isoleucine patch superfamily enzyme